jgi:hypothetical protein
MASMPPNLKEQGSDFDKRVVAYMRQKWTKERTNFTAEDRATIEQLRGLTQMFKAAAVQIELQNNYIRYQARIMTDVR